MAVKILGALMILVSGSSIGWILASSYLNRLKELIALQTAIQIIDTEINYGQTMLASAIKKAAICLDKPLAELFISSAEILSKNTGKTFAEIWEEAIRKKQLKLFLKEEDLAVLLEWGRQIGNSSLTNQKKINTMAVKRLEQLESSAREVANTRVKMVRYAGVLISLLIIILFY